MYRLLFNVFALVSFASAYNVQSSKFVKEAEIKHGRVAMVSSVAIPLLDNIKPDTLGVNFVNSLDNDVQLGLLAVVGCSEVAQLLKAYNFPEDPSKWFTMKDSHVPGDYSFDPLSLNKNNSTKVKTNELTVGRIAMLAVAYQLVYEFFTQTPVLKLI
jgi:hypothetical protein